MNTKFTIMFLCILFAAVGKSFAQVSWTNPAGGNWSDGANWSGGSAPGLADAVEITLNGTYTVTVDVDIDVVSLEIGGATGVQTVDASSDDITISGASTINSNGELYVSSSTVSGSGVLTNNGTFTLNQSNTIDVDVVNADTILFIRHNNDWNGSLTTTASSVIQFDGATWHPDVTFATGFTNNGKIEFLSTLGYNSTLYVSSGELVNAAGASIEGKGVYSNVTRTLSAPLNNQGLVSAEHNMTLTHASEARTNTGDIVVAPDKILTVSGAADFNFDGGTASGGGQMLFLSTTANFNVGNFPDIDLHFNISTLNSAGLINNNRKMIFEQQNVVNATIANSDTILFIRHINSWNGALTTTPSSVIQLDGVTWHPDVTFASGFTNNGKIELLSTLGYNTTLNVTSGELVNAPGASIEGKGVYGNVGRTIGAPVNNQGLLSAEHNMTLTHATDARTNTGDIIVAADKTLTVSGAADFNFNGGTASGDGKILFSSTSANFNVSDFPEIDLHFNITTLNSGGIINNNRKMIFEQQNVVNATIANSDTILFIRHINTWNGALTTTPTSVIQMDGVTWHPDVTFANGFTNNGKIELLSTLGYNTTMNVTTGELIIAPGASFEGKGVYGNVGRTLNAPLNNQGLFSAEHNMTLTHASEARSNTGDIVVAADKILTVSGAADFNFNGGTATGDGKILFSSTTANFNVSDFPDVDLHFNISTLNSGGLINNDRKMIFEQQNNVNATIANSDTILFIRHINAWNGALTTTASSVIQLDGVTWHPDVTFANGFTNNGKIELLSTLGYNTTMNVTTGELVNAAGASIEGKGVYGNVGRTLNMPLNNQGHFSAEHNMTLTHASEAKTNTGNISVAGDKILTISGASDFDFNGGTATGDGKMLFSSTTANFNVADFPDIDLHFNITNLNSGGVINSDRMLIFEQQNNINATIANSDTILFIRHINAWNGALTTTPTSVIQLDGVTWHPDVIFANGFTNNGRIELLSTLGFNTTVNVSAGELINAPGATIDAKGVYGGISRTILGQLNNQGDIHLEKDLNVAGSSFVNAANGLIDGSAILNVSGTTFTNEGEISPGTSPGKIDLIGNLTNTPSSSFTVELEGDTAGTEYDQLAVTNDAILGGTLDISVPGPYSPVEGDSFVVLTYGTRTDSFATITGQDLGNGLWLNEHYRPGHLVLVAGDPPTVPRHTITATAGLNGSISPAGDVEVSEGDDQLFTITPDQGYHVLDVEVDGQSVGALTEYIFVSVTAAHSIHATFEVNTYTITATAGAGGSIAPSGAVSVTGGTDQTFVITPDVGYHVLDVVVDGQSLGALSSYVFNSVFDDHTIEAYFEINTYTINATATSGGSIAPDGSVLVQHGDDQLFTMAADSGYFLANVIVDGQSVGAVANYTFNAVDANHAITAVFALETHTITATAGSGGVLNPGGNVVVPAGSDQQFDVIPNPGYSITEVLVDGQSVGAVASYTFTNVSANHTIEASFTQNSYTITATAGSGGSIDPEGVIAVLGGENQAFTVTPDSGYGISDVIVDGQSLGAVGVYTFTQVSANHTIDAVFVQQDYVIVASAGANGTISPSGAVNVTPGGSQLFSITPNIGYEISDVYVDGASVGQVSTYEFTNVTSNHAISAYFWPEGFAYEPLSIGTTNDLTGVSFIDDLNGFAVGDGGVIFYTTDGGQTWQPSNHNSTTDLTDIQIIGSNIYATGANGTVCVSYDGGATWINIGPTIVETLHGCSFINGYYGYAVGTNGAIYWYNGSTWVQQFIGGTNYNFYGVYAIGNTAYAVGASGMICAYIPGQGWVFQNPPGSGPDFNGVTFYNPSFGYAVGSGGAIWQTTDGGVTWIALNTGTTSINFYNCFIISETVAYVVGDGGVIYQTTDGGATWVEIFFGAPFDFQSISFANCRGYVVGAGGIAYGFDVPDCVNGISQLYDRVTLGTHLNCNGVSFIDANNGCVAGNGGTVLVTTDGGNSWTSSNTGTITDLTNIKLIDDAAFITGYNGLICRSNDAGATWIPYTTNTTEVFYASSFLSKNYGFAVGGAGTICVYNGTSWVAQTTNTVETFYGVWVIGGTAYAVGSNGIICRYNGASWVPQTSGTSVNFYDVAFVNEDYGFVVGDNGTICRTRDGGNTWVPLNSGSNVKLKACKVVSPKVIYCLGDDGTVLMSDDCGETWADVSLEFDVDFFGLEIVEGQGFLIGELGSAYTFSDPDLIDIPLYVNDVDSVDFGEVLITEIRTDSILVHNPGTASLLVNPVTSSDISFSVSPDSAAIDAGDSLYFVVTFDPAATGAHSGTISFTHGASCWLDSVIVMGTGVDLGPGDIAGNVTVNGNGISNVLVTLIDINGDPVEGYEPIMTDGGGYYEFLAIAAPDSYQVVIVEPLGYTLGEQDNPKSTWLEPGGTSIVDFTLDEVVVANTARGPAYWRHVINSLVRGRSCHITEEIMLGWIGELHEHYTPYYDVFDGLETLEDWQTIFNLPCGSGMYERARAQVAALALNHAALKIGQYTIVTEDDRTAGDVLTYTSELLTDGDDANDWDARFFASRVNRHIMIAAGEIPVGGILYKGGQIPSINWGFGIPEEFAMHQNYPNPFNPRTTIKYDLPLDAEVILDVYNVLGQRVATLVNGFQRAGSHQVQFDGRNLASGIYIYRIQAAKYSKVYKMILTK